MYAVGTPVLYGRTGVCRVERIGASPLSEKGGERYYTLRSVFSTSDELIYIPVNTAVSMRPLIGGEASRYLEGIPELRPRAFSSRRPAELAARKKKLGQVDARYLKIAERLVCEEFAMALGTGPERIKERVYAAMECEAPGQ